MYKLSYLCTAFIICLTVSINGHAAKWASVTAEKAVIYSDMQMTSKIGFIKKGKRVRVGEVLRNNGQLLPIIVNQKVAYIKVSDLQTSSRLEALQSASKRIKEQAKKSDARPRRLALFSAGFFADSEISGSTNTLASDSKGSINFLGFGLKDYAYQMDGSRAGLKTGLEYYTGTSDPIEFNYFTISAAYFKHLLNWSVFDIVGYGGLTLSPFSEIKNSNLYTLNGLGYGFHGGVEGVVNVAGLYLHADMSFHHLTLAGFDYSKIDNDYGEVDFTLSGIRLMGAISVFYQ